ncbi:Ig-like domain-containing protein [Nakamurella sp. A5-74]|uniref:Ig-like domain-containing protein n=1 Tax=Nakamurella sp. A5-74 TaxID=3158264 RepID=A0AAU8DLW9_9ACTN
MTPGNGATKVDPLARITARATGGVITHLKIINPDGKVVFHQFKINKSSYALIPELGFERRYTVQIGTKSAGGRAAVTTSTFVTVRPKAKITTSITPNQGALVGTGQPIEITFSRPIADSARRSVESQISVTSTSKQGGAFRWYSSTVVRWRPATMWKANTRVTVAAEIYGKQLTPGGYGAEDRLLTFNVIRDVRSVVNARTHLMSVYSGGRLVREMKVSLGNDKYPTPNGIYVVTQKLPTHVMDSSTWGLRGAGAYRTKVKWATRVSSGGIFVHGAPWSEYAQGKDNVSHGCINVTDALAEWYQKYSYPGDTVKVINSNGPALQPWDGFGDWNIPFAKY